MLHRPLLLAGLLASALASAAPAHALSAGDLSFTAFNADEDGFALVALADIAPGAQVYFTDNEWDGSAFNSGESFSSWTATGLVAAGTVIRFSSIDTPNLAASTGSYVREAVTGSTNYGVSQAADTLYAYLGTSATTPTLFLAAISSGVFGTTADGSLLGTGLAIGSGAVQLGAGSDFAQYSGDRSSQLSFAAYKSLVSDIANWTDLGDGSYAALVPDTTPFTSAIPEPGSYALMLAGLLAMGFIARRRS